MSKSLSERVAAKSLRDLETGCLLWQGYLLPDGYGRFTLNGRKTLVHRAVWEDHHGRAIAEGAHIDHLCKRRNCVEITHLEEVSPAENAARAALVDFCRKGHPIDKSDPETWTGTGCRACVREAATRHRERVAAGHIPTRAMRLTEAEARRIRDGGESAHSLANELGISRKTVADIRSGRTWRHLDGEIEKSPRKRGRTRFDAKLTEGAVREIKALLLDQSNQEIADRYGVSRWLISKIRRGVAWKHVT